MKTVKYLILFLAVLVQQPVSAQETTKVGAILSLSGEFAEQGLKFQKGLDLRLMDEGGIEIIYEDDVSYSDKATISAYRKLVTIDKASVVLVMGVPSIPPLLSTIKQLKVPVICIWDQNKLIEANGDYVFSVGYTNELDGAGMADFIVAKLQHKRAALVSAHDEWSEILSTAFTKRFRELGGTVDSHDIVDLEEKHFQPIISKIKRAGSPVLFFPLYSSSLGNLIKRARELQFEGELVTGEGLFDRDIKNLGAAAEGIYAQRVWATDEKFIERYRSEVSKEADRTSLGYAALGYDAGEKVANALKVLADKEWQITGENMAKGLSAVKNPEKMLQFVVVKDRQVSQLP